MKSNLLITTTLIFIIQLNCELKFVLEMFRHGARSPNSGIDNKDNTFTDVLGEVWNGGKGELTNMGIRQQFLLGWSKNKYGYKNLLSKSFNPGEMQIFSINLNRTLMSAQSNLFGLYTPGTGPQLLQNQTMYALPPVLRPADYSDIIENLDLDTVQAQSQIFPVQTYGHAYALLQEPFVCPGLTKFVDLNKKDQETALKDFNDKYSEKLKKALNIEQDGYFKDVSNIHRLTDTFMCDYFDQRKLDKLVKVGIDLKEFHTDSIKFTIISHLEKYFGDEDLFTARIMISPFFKTIIETVDKIIENDKLPEDKQEDITKYMMHSVHETNLWGMQKLIRKWVIKEETKMTYPVFASNLIFELSKDGDKYNILIRINEETLIVSYDDFKKNITPHLVQQSVTDQTCKVETEVIVKYVWEIVIISPLVICNTFLIIVITILYRKRNMEKKANEKILLANNSA